MVESIGIAETNAIPLGVKTPLSECLQVIAPHVVEWDIDLPSFPDELLDYLRIARRLSHLTPGDYLDTFRHDYELAVCAHVVVTITRQDAWKVRLTCRCGRDILMDEKRAA